MLLTKEGKQMNIYLKILPINNVENAEMSNLSFVTKKT